MPLEAPVNSERIKGTLRVPQGIGRALRVQPEEPPPVLDYGSLQDRLEGHGNDGMAGTMFGAPAKLYSLPVFKEGKTPWRIVRIQAHILIGRGGTFALVAIADIRPDSSLAKKLADHGIDIT